VTAYYNEIDPYAAQWLRNLIAGGHIAPGDVDERSIVDVRADDLAGYTQCHFFAGIAGWSLALRLAGWPDDRSVWTGSCPCQPFSLAGAQKGFDDDRHLWPVWRGLIAQRRPPVVFGEQVASATEWLGLVRGDLEALGYAVGAMPIQAASAGADHLRDRFWFVADANDAGLQGRELLSERADQRPAGPDGVADSASLGSRPGLCESDAEQHRNGVAGGRSDGSLADAGGGRCAGPRQGQGEQPGRTEAERSGDLDWVIGADGKARRVKPGLRLLAHDVPARVGRLRAYGNAIVPQVAAAFIEASMTPEIRNDR
jgi:DNA (cytosine-5)-methyltransferase 1